MRSPLSTLLLLAGLSATAPAAVDFSKQIQPLLEQRCLGCHNAEKAAGGLALHSSAAVRKGGTSGPVLVPGDPAKSLLYATLEAAPNSRAAMPPGGPRLSDAERQAFHEWIQQGAEWPAGLTLTARKADGVPDERELVNQLQARIGAAALPKNAAEMQSYRMTIPGSVVSFEMVPVRAGEFLMGTPENETGRTAHEGPVHKVKLDAFWMGKLEVTWDEYRLFMFAQQAGEASAPNALVDAVSRPTRPYVEMSFGMGLNGFPAISMTQHAANKFAQWLSAKTGQFYRLPTEAEWEYACRAGSQQAYSFGAKPEELATHAWFADNSDGKYQKAGTKKPNAWGLHDMHGNVMEWTLDRYAPRYDVSASVNPYLRPDQPYPQAVRGGGWNDPADRLRCGARVASDSSWKMQDPQLPKSIWYHTDAQWLGFRVVRPLQVPSAEQMFLYWNNGVELD